MIKVVHVVEALGGGVNSYFKDLSFFFGEEEIKQNIQTTIIYSDNRVEIDPSKIEKEFSNNVDLLKINMVRAFSPSADLKSIIELRKALKQINPDIIHLHSSKAGVLGRVAHFLNFDKKKIYYTPHGYAFIRKDISNLNKKLYWLIEKYFQKIFGGETIACGDTEFKIASKIGKSHLVRNGINIQNVSSHYQDISNDKLTIGILGRITFARNPKLFNDIARRFPNYNFVWIGDGELNHLLTSPNIKITGWFFNHSEAIKELNKLDIYIQTSLWEGLPIAVLEAMSLYKPVVATNIIGNKDIVINNKNGFLFDKIEELDSYFKILENKEQRKKIGEKAYDQCNRLFDKNKNFEQLLELYKL